MRTGLVITLSFCSWVYGCWDQQQVQLRGNVALPIIIKAPASWFNRRLLRNKEVVEIINETVEQLQQFNPAIK